MNVCPIDCRSVICVGCLHVLMNVCFQSLGSSCLGFKGVCRICVPVSEMNRCSLKQPGVAL